MKYILWLDKVPYSSLLIGALLMGLAPFFPMPHLVEKSIMLKDGLLTKPIDIFDVFFHMSPAVLLILKVILDKKTKK